MTERPQRLVPTAVAAFKAARKIPWGVKAVFVEDWILDNSPDGAWISGSNLAARLGMSRDTVERHRRWLLSLGFYHVVRRAGCKSDGWVPTLPLGCRHRGTSPADIQATAARIDALLSGTVLPVEGGVPAFATRRGGTHAANDGGTHAANNGGTHAAIRAGGVQSLIQHPSEGQALALPVDRARDGAFAPGGEQEEQEGEPKPRAIDQRPAAEVTDEGFRDLRRRRQEWKDAAKGAAGIEPRKASAG
jgi:hypothetical protein